MWSNTVSNFPRSRLRPSCVISTLLRLFGSVYDKDTRKGLFPHNLSLSLQDHPLTLLALLLTFSIYLDLILALALLAARCFSLRVLSLTGPRNPLSALCSPGQLYFRASGRSTHLSLLGLFTHLHSPVRWHLVFPSSLTPLSILRSAPRNLTTHCQARSTCTARCFTRTRGCRDAIHST